MAIQVVQGMQQGDGNARRTRKGDGQQERLRVRRSAFLYRIREFERLLSVEPADDQSSAHTRWRDRVAARIAECREMFRGDLREISPRLIEITRGNIEAVADDLEKYEGPEACMRSDVYPGMEQEEYGLS